jgi:predicted PurR-regulated permease PerM
MEPPITLALREEARLNGEAGALAVEPAGRRTGTVALTGLFIIAVFYTLYTARAVLLPVVLAFHVGLLLAPAVAALRRARLPEPVGAAVVLAALLAGLGGGFYLLAGPASDWMARLPGSFRTIEHKIRDVRKPVEAVRQAAEEVDKITAGQPAAGRAPVVEVKEPGVFDAMLSGTHTLVAGAVLMLLTLYFFLASGDLFLRKVIRVLPRLADKKRAVEIARETERQVSAYLATITVINAALATVLGVIFALMGLPSPALWAVMAFVLNFIPFLGPLTGVVVLGVVAAVTFPTLGHALAVPAIYFVLHNVETNIITPLVLGRRLTLNPLVIFLWLSLWFWLWGIPGALLAVPMLKTLKIFCDNIPSLAPMGEFLGS